VSILPSIYSYYEVGGIPVCDDLVRALKLVASTIADEVRRAEEVARSIKELSFYKLKIGVGSLPSVVASDSSRVFKNLSVAMVFAIQAVAIRSSASGSPALRTRAEAGSYVISFEERGSPADEIVDRVSRFVAKDMEVSTSAELLDGADVALFDGSIFSFLWYGKLPEVPRELRLTLPWRPSTLRDLWRSIARGLLEVRGRVLPMFIAKSIRKSYYVERVLPNAKQSREREGALNDLVLLNYMRRRGLLPRVPHIIEPMYLEKVEELPKPLKTLDPEDRTYVEPLLPVTVTYVAFGSSTQYYQVTVPGRLSPEELTEVLSSLYPYSRSGYPDPLRVAHSRCRVTSREFRLLLAKLGLSYVPTGREPLGEFL